MHQRRIAVFGFVCSMIAGVAVPASGQTSEPPVSRLVPDLVAAASRLFQGPTADNTDHFVTSATNLAVLGDWNRAIARQSANYPMGPSTGGVAFFGDAGEGPVVSAASSSSRGRAARDGWPSASVIRR